MKLSNGFYVDNCLISLPNVEALYTFIQEAKEIIAQARFDLQGWENSEFPNKDTTLTPLFVLILEQGFICAYQQ